MTNALEVHVPKPLEYLTETYIAPENTQILERERRRFYLLSFWERIRLMWHVRQLRRRLVNYNALVIERNELRIRAAELKARYAAEPDKANMPVELRDELRALKLQWQDVTDRLSALADMHNAYTHYREWLQYERTHRAELKRQAKIDRELKRGMDQETRIQERLMIKAFRHTPKCHTERTDGKGKLIVKAPKFFRRETTPDAIYFWLDTSKPGIFGWRVHIPANVNVSDLMDEPLLTNAKAYTHRDVTVTWSDMGQIVYRVSRLDSPDALPKLVRWKDLQDTFKEHRRAHMPYLIGVSEKRRAEWLELEADAMILVAGKQKSGKSNMINGWIGTWLSRYSPAEVRFIMIDQKGGVEYSHWAEAPHLLWELGTTVEDVKPILIRVIKLMHQRMKLFKSVHKKTFLAYNRTATTPLPRLIVCLDELATLVGLGELTEELHNLLTVIASQGRAFGISLICATQQPSVDVIKGRTKANMGVRVAGYMPSVSASMTVLDHDAAAKLPNVPGRFIVDNGGHGFYTVQAPLITDDDIAFIVHKANNDYPDTSDQLDEERNIPHVKAWGKADVIAVSIELANGSLSGQRLHKLLGDDSPGERHLKSVCRQITDEAGDHGTLTHNGTSYDVRRNTKGRGWMLVRSDGLDGLDVLDVVAVPDASVLSASEPGQPLGESAAD